ncbi:hypothetical protein ACYSNR_12305 [Enterococcus sp. LJL128]
MKRKVWLVTGLLFVSVGLMGCGSNGDKAETSKSSTEKTSEVSSEESSTEEITDEVKESSSEEAGASSEIDVKSYTADNGEAFEYGLLERWQEFDDIQSVNPAASFAFTNGSSAVAAIFNDKGDVADYATFKNLVVEQMQQTTGVTITFEPTTMNDMAGDRASFDAEIQGIKLHYVIYLLESDQNYIQLLTWSMQSKFASEEKVLEEAAHTFKMVK